MDNIKRFMLQWIRNILDDGTTGYQPDNVITNWISTGLLYKASTLRDMKLWRNNVVAIWAPAAIHE